MPRTASYPDDQEEAIRRLSLAYSDLDGDGVDLINRIVILGDGDAYMMAQRAEEGGWLVEMNAPLTQLRDLVVAVADEAVARGLGAEMVRWQPRSRAEKRAIKNILDVPEVPWLRDGDWFEITWDAGWRLLHGL
jgi:hypothetical protein